MSQWSLCCNGEYQHSQNTCNSEGMPRRDFTKEWLSTFLLSTSGDARNHRTQFKLKLNFGIIHHNLWAVSRSF
jgi:hypothetical protein